MDPTRIREVLSARIRAPKDKPALSNLLYGAPPLLGSQVASQSIVDFLAGVPALQSFSKKELGYLSLFLHERSFGNGEVIFEQGTPASAFYLIRSGNVELTRRINGVEGALATLTPNELFGEIALLAEEAPRYIGARSKGASELLALPRPDFDALMTKSPAVGVKLLRALTGIVAERFRLLLEVVEGGSEK